MIWWVESTNSFLQLNYIEDFLILASTITGCVSTFDFASLIGIPIGITSSAIKRVNKLERWLQKLKSISQ